MKKFFSSTYLCVIILLIYIPIFVLALMSFNSGQSMSIFQGFSDRWYKELAEQTPFINSIIVSIFVAVFATIISTIIGTMAAIGISKSKRVTQKMVLSVSNIPLVNADVVTAVALMLTFLALSANFGIITLVLSHISFDVPYVIMAILPRLSKIDQSLIDASLDLGAKPSRTLRKIVLPILKPAIISAAAIAFAMSFDDFIISYFNGGDQVNVATFIYTLKRLKPYVNAFGTICILIIGVIIFAWNIYVLLNSQTKKFKAELLSGTYRDRDLYNLEMKLITYYHNLNFKTGKKMEFPYKYWLKFKLKVARKVFKLKGSSLSKIREQIALTETTHLMRYKTRLRKRICKLENKQDSIIKWIVDKKTKFQQIREDVEEHNKNMRLHFRWITRTWKPVVLTIIVLGAMSLLTGFYILNNSYDLSVANWGEYIDMSLINQFDKENNVKVKYNVFDSNESLYNKLYTTNYDVLVPSDYMVKKLASEHRLAKFDYKQLNAMDENYYYYAPLTTIPDDAFNSNPDKTPNPNYCLVSGHNNCVNLSDPQVLKKYQDDLSTGLINDYKKRGQLQPNLIWQNWNNKWSSVDDKGSVVQENILNYSIPYLWGDIEMVINPNQKTWLEQKNVKIDNNMTIDNNTLSWNILWQAAADGKNVLINDDYKNLFMLANEKNYQHVLPQNLTELNQDFADLQVLLKHSNVALMNDEIINNVADGNFDFAFMYNGDAIYADNAIDNGNNYRYLIAHPRYQRVGANGQEGTNIWSDNMAITTSCKNTKLAYKFINFILQHYDKITEYTSYTTPTNQVLNYEINDNFKKYERVYRPVSKLESNGYITSPQRSDGPFLLTHLDSEMVNKYNILISQKN